jgi:YbbR domain-containing protein
MARISVREIFRKIYLSLRHNWVLKLVSLLFAIILWNYVIALVNPSRIMTYRDVTIGQPIGLTQLENKGLTIKSNIAALLEDARVDVALNRGDEARLWQSGGMHIWVSVDLSGITQEGPNSVKVNYSSSAGTIKAFSPDTISVTVEKIKKRAVPIVFSPTGALPDGYWMGDAAILTPQSQVVQISGAVSDVNKVVKAIVQVPLDGRTEDFKEACDFVLVDGDGATVPSSGLHPDPQNCIVEFSVLPTKEVRINTTNSVYGNPAKGYELSGLPIPSSSTMKIAAPADILSKIDSVQLGRVDIGSASGDVTALAAVQLPEGVHAVNGNTVSVVVKIVPKMVTRTIRDVPIEFKGLAAGLQPDGSYTGTLTYTCPELSVPDLKADFFHLVVDATDLGAGQHTLAVTASCDDADAGVTLLTPSPAEISVKLTAS